jgi:hypothetical protein
MRCARWRPGTGDVRVFWRWRSLSSVGAGTVGVGAVSVGAVGAGGACAGGVEAVAGGLASGGAAGFFRTNTRIFLVVGSSTSTRLCESTATSSPSAFSSKDDGGATTVSNSPALVYVLTRGRPFSLVTNMPSGMRAICVGLQQPQKYSILGEARPQYQRRSPSKL